MKLEVFKLRFRVFVISVVFLTVGQAQIPSNPLGNNKLGLQWQQIETDKVNLIFPKGMNTQANRIVNLVHSLWENDSPSIGNNHVKAPIILQPQTVLSNGFVTVAPFRSEFFARAPQFDGTTDWLDHLTIHEYQHIKQFNQSRQGITGLVRKILGDWAWGGMLGLAIPRWYFEGDAVIAETAFTNSGRGRFPDFTMEYKSLLDIGIKYEYEKAAAGSFKDYVPNWYNLGYHLLSYGRQEYGAELWKNATADAVRYKGLFYPFNKSIQKQTGRGIKQLYSEMMDDFERSYNQQKESMLTDESSLLIQKTKPTVISYSNPQFSEDGNLWIQEAGYDRIRSFRQIDLKGNFQEKKRSGFLLDGAMSQNSVSAGKMCWAELAWDIRRRYRRFSEIVVIDLKTNQRKRLTKNQFDYSPSLNEEGDKIVAIRVDENLVPRIIILDAVTGQINKEILNPEAYQLTYCQWLNSENILIVTKANQENRIQKININSGDFEPLSESTADPISHLAVSGSKVYFSKPINDINQIFQLHLKSREILQLTHDKVGAYQPAISPDENKLAYSSFSHKGYDIRLIDIDESSGTSKKSLRHYYQSPYLKSLMKQETENLLSTIKNDTFTVEKFNRFSGLLKPHSILTNFTTNTTELTVLSDNVFSTLSADATASYRYNEDTWRYSVGLTYAELFPEISLRAERVGRSAALFNYAMISDSTIQQRRYVERWRENRLRAGVVIPLTFSSGQTTRSMTFAGRVNRHQLNVDQNYNEPDFTTADTISFTNNTRELQSLISEPLGNETFTSIDLIWSGRIQRFTARQHMRSRFGLSAFMRYRKPFSVNVQGDVFECSGTLFLPGIKRNHSFSIEMDYQREDLLSNYRFSDNFDYARGYNRSLRVDELTKIAVNYRLPLWYPDIAAGGLAFVKRVKANIFYDHGIIGVQSFPFVVGNQSMRSAGVELGFDVRLLRLLEVDLGVRYSYLMDSDFVLGHNHVFNFFVVSISQ